MMIILTFVVVPGNMIDAPRLCPQSWQLSPTQYIPKVWVDLQMGTMQVPEVLLN